MTYTPCSALDAYIPLWEEFAGDKDLLEEIIDHKAGCPICLANMREAEKGHRADQVEADPRDELLPLERQDVGRWLEVEAQRLGIVPVEI